MKKCENKQTLQTLFETLQTLPREGTLGYPPGSEGPTPLKSTVTYHRYRSTGTGTGPVPVREKVLSCNLIKNYQPTSFMLFRSWPRETSPGTPAVSSASLEKLPRDEP